MIAHFFKLIWNKKRSHALLMVEILASFMVLFGVMSLIVYNFQNYLEPIGFKYENVWALDLSSNQDTTAIPDKLAAIYQKVRTYPEVETASRMSNNSPFSMSTSNREYTYEKNSILGDYYSTDEFYSQTLDIPTIEGKWYQPSDRVAKYMPVVINKKAKEALFANISPIGKVLNVDDDSQLKIVGVVENFKAKGEFMENEPCVFVLPEEKSYNSTILIKVRPGTDANFEAKLTRDIISMTKDWAVEVSYLTDQRQNQSNLTLVPVIIFLIISAFLLSNVVLGLFGIMNLNIARRRDEIGVRRAMGATSGNIKTQFVGEMWVIATFGIIIGLIFAIQFPIMNVFDVASGVYLMAILVSIAIIYLLVTICAYYPSRLAAKIRPAMALRED